MSRKKMGRPKLPKAKSRNPGLSVRLLPSEQKEIEIAIETSGENKSTWIRDALLEKARRQHG